MKRAVMMVVAACTAAMLGLDADARRLGGGRSFGAPRDVATQRQMTPPPQNSAAPATPSAAPSTAPAPVAARAPVGTPPPVAAPSGWRRFIGPVAGIAAGLGIAALMSHMGLSEAFGNFLVILLLIVGLVLVLRLVFRRPAAQGAQSGGLQYAGAGAGSGATFDRAPATPAFGGASGATAAGNAADSRAYPPGFDPEPFLQQAKMNFSRVQTAYDQGDTELLRDVMTPDMFAETTRDLAARGTHAPTGIVRLNAEILEVATEGDHHWATVRFHGLTREDGVETPQPFDEAWNLRKAADGSTGWLLAGIQQLQ